MLEDKIRHRIKGLDKLGENCNYMFHDAELQSINYVNKDYRCHIELVVRHWKIIDGEYKDALITFVMNDVQSYQMDNNYYVYALEIYFEEYDGQSQGFFDDCMRVSSDIGFSIVCKSVDITNVELIEE